MKRIKEFEKEKREEQEFNNNHEYKQINEENKKEEYSNLKKIENEKVRDIIDEKADASTFRKIVGLIVLILIIFSVVLPSKTQKRFQENITVGLNPGVKPGYILSKDALNLEPTDIEVKVGDGIGKIELSIWNFNDEEDGDYVQVFVNGEVRTEPFKIIHRATKVSVPSKGIIQIKGIKDGSNNGITYGVFFNKTGETYLNIAPLNGENSYTLKTSN